MLARMIDPDEEEPYHVAPDDKGAQYQVLDWEGGVVMVCGDEHSAGHYAALLNAAFRRGFKAGFRQARRG